MDEYEDAMRRMDGRALTELRGQLLEEALEYLEDPELTAQKARLWEALMREMWEIKKDLEAKRQEHRTD